ncbi:MAG: polymer-forming cytoskeletal protein [Lachnospiraceae bacterium]|nr:polymer-forming cytoskeletal protein [Lachnospiraceae bacterium]
MPEIPEPAPVMPEAAAAEPVMPEALNSMPDLTAPVMPEAAPEIIPDITVMPETAAPSEEPVIQAYETMEPAETSAASLSDIQTETNERVEQSMSEAGMAGFDDANLSEESGMICGGMTINGDISNTGSLDVIGTVNGNITIRGKLNVSGSVSGNSKAAEVFADSAKITGDIESAGPVKVGQETVIIGNISATSAVIAGAVKGDIDVQGPVILDTSAIVMGNIKSKSVQINNGAVIEGHCSQCYADVSPASFFNASGDDRAE